MKQHLPKLIPVAIIGAGVGGLMLFGQPPEPDTSDNSDETQAVLVEVEEVTEWTDPVNIEVDGEAATYKIVTLSSEVDGRVIEKPETSRGGMYVREKQLLFRIDDTNYTLQADRLKVQLEQNAEEQRATAIEVSNTAELIQLAEEDLALQQKQVARLQALQKRGTANDREVEEAQKQKLVSRNALVSLQNQKRTSEQKLKTQEAAAKVIQAELDRVNTDIERCTVKSPLTGRVVDDTVEQGDYIKAGTNLAHISDSSRMEVRTKLRSEQLAWVWLQHEVMNNEVRTSEEAEKRKEETDPLNLPPVACEVAFEFEGVETIWDGYIARLEGTGIDRDTRTFPCRVLVEHPEKTRVRKEDEGRQSVRPPGLVAGMYVSVRIPVRSPTRVLRLPVEAVRPGGNVWVKREGELQIVPIEPVYSFDDHVLVWAMDSPVQVGDSVIVSPLASVENKMKVTTKKEEKPSKSDTGNDAEAKTTEKKAEASEATSPAKETEV